jgi:hypothetical protein
MNNIRQINVKTRFNYSPTKKLKFALGLLKDLFPIIDRLLRALPYTSIDTHQYVIALLVKMRWNAEGAFSFFRKVEPFNAAPLVRAAFEALVYMKAALHDNQTFQDIVSSDLARRKRMEKSVEIAQDKIKRRERFQQKDMPRYPGKRISIEQLARKVGFDLYWTYYPLLSAETHPSPLHIYRTCVVHGDHGKVYINVNPQPAYNETLALILVQTLINGTRIVSRMESIVGFGEDLDKILAGYEYVIRMEGKDIL